MILKKVILSKYLTNLLLRDKLRMEKGMRKMRYDVIIVGAGPAGLFCAYELAENNPKLKVAIFATEEKTTFIDMQDFSGNIFDLIDNGENYIRKNIRWSANFNTGSFERADIPEVPIRAMREILCNSFLHRNWNEPYDNDLAIYSNRIEISNPGHFTEEATPEDYIYKTENLIKEFYKEH